MHPVFDFDDNASVARLVLEHYGIQVDVKRLPGELDLNFRISSGQDLSEKWCLKVSGLHATRQELELQHAALGWLKKASLDFDIPSVRLSNTGQDLLEIPDSTGALRFVRMFSWVDGKVFAETSPHRPGLLFQFGERCGQLSKGLQGFFHPEADRFIKWDPKRWEWIQPHLSQFPGKRRELAEYFFGMSSVRIHQVASVLRTGVNYNDANDYNFLVTGEAEQPVVSGVIDFGDLVQTWTVSELAIGLAYAVMHKPDPADAALPVIRGYHSRFPLTPEEVFALYPLMVARLLISVTCSEINRAEHPENTYLQVSDAPAWEVLERLRSRSPEMMHYLFREACGMEPVPSRDVFDRWVSANRSDFHQPIELPSKVVWLDLGIGSLDLGTMAEIRDPEILNRCLSGLVRDQGDGFALGRYGEARAIYSTDAFRRNGNDGPVWRSHHLGIDYFCPEGTSVSAVADGMIFSIANNSADRDYGPTIILRHAVDSGKLVFYSLYGHLNSDSLAMVKEGMMVKAGDIIGSVGGYGENGKWTPHLHVQFILDMLGGAGEFPGVCCAQEFMVWQSLCPDPWQVLTGKSCPQVPGRTGSEIVDIRRRHLGKNLSISYKEPIVVLRGYRQYLIGHDGRHYLDTVNNVAHVGHEHPRVVKAGQRQMAVLNTNTRYLHRNIVDFTEAFLRTLPPSLDVLFMVNSGSEANELAIRLARTYTGQYDMIVSQVGYHGNTNACVEVSSYKFDGPGGKGAADHIHVVPMPDTYRGLYRAPDAEAGLKYAAHVGGALSKIQHAGRGVAGFLFESVISCGGQVELPSGFLAESYRMVRAAGGLCIADEVQTGCGRAGDHYWAFEAHGVVPDILTVGKPIGNGHPLGVVATTQAVAEAFRNGMEYFNTFGGNPVSCAIGKEVLDVVREEGLQEHARQTGAYLKAGLRDLMQRFPVIGDVRGPGLFIGFELVNDPLTRDPATKKASWLANRMREKGILMSTDGPYNNVLKIKPPMVFSRGDADQLLEAIGLVLAEDPMRI